MLFLLGWGESEQEMKRCGYAGRKHVGHPGQAITLQLARELVPVAVEMGGLAKCLPCKREDPSPGPRTI